MIPRLTWLAPLALVALLASCTDTIVGPAPLAPQQDASKMHMDCSDPMTGEECTQGPYDLNNLDADYQDESYLQTFSTVEQVQSSPIIITGATFGTVTETGRVEPLAYVTQDDCLKAVLKSVGQEYRMLAREYGCPVGPCFSAYNASQQAYLAQNLFAVSSWVLNIAAWVTPQGRASKTVIVWARVGAGTGAVFTNIENYANFNRKRAELAGCITNNVDFYYEQQQANVFGIFPEPRYGW
jgi:hypothetical protein